MTTVKSIGFYILSFTWGIIMTIIGCLVALALIITGHKPKRFHDRIYFEVGSNWGGVELGPFFLKDTTPSLHIKQHESGHGFQNTILGPAMPFLVSIPSAIRYWLREFKTQKGKYIFTAILVGVLLIVLTGCFVPALIFNVVWLLIVSGLLLIYILCIACWLLFCEIPKYAVSSPLYDSIWFEGQASRWGAIMYPEDSNK